MKTREELIIKLKESDHGKLMSLKDKIMDNRLRTSAIQRDFGWGYNRTMQALNYAVEKGALLEYFDRGFLTHFSFNCR